MAPNLGISEDLFITQEEWSKTLSIIGLILLIRYYLYMRVPINQIIQTGKKQKKAKACLDWMMLEAALHYLNGFHIAADARAKSIYLNNNPRGIGVYTYAFFTDENNHPSFGEDYWDTHDPRSHESGFLINTDYQPPIIRRDIAQRNFELPVEIRSAKPFYHLDFGDYFNSNRKPYHYWKGDNKKSRRFEFETIYMNKNFLMSSIAGGRPDGRQGTFSEQAQWEIGVKGTDNGALQISGNAGYAGQTPAGRCPYYEIGQFRNVIIHLSKSPSSNQFFVLIPYKNDNLRNSGLGTNFEWNNNNLFMDMGNDVYIAFINYNQSNHSVDNSTGLGDGHTKVTSNFPNNELGSIIIEVGTADEFTSFDSFKTALNSPALSTINDTTIKYISATGHTIRMAYTSTTFFKMTEGTEDTPSPNPTEVAKNYPKVRGNGEFIDYSTWNNYETVLGPEIVNQKWESDIMDLSNGNEKIRVKADPYTAEVNYYKKDEDTPSFSPNFEFTNPDSFSNNSFLNPIHENNDILWDIDNDLNCDLSGDNIKHEFTEDGVKKII